VGVFAETKLGKNWVGVMLESWKVGKLKCFLGIGIFMGGKVF
jgi:hypothetical protein